MILVFVWKESKEVSGHLSTIT